MEVELLKPYNLKIISFSDQGSRSRNEDRVYYSHFDQRAFLLLVADGMGGYEQGDLAAETAIEIIAKNIIDNNNEDIVNKIELAFLKAHLAINKKLNNSGATVGGVVVFENDVYVFWAGDVKIVLNNGGNVFVSKEHTLLNLLKESEIIIKPEEVKRLSHTVVKSVGGKSNSHSPEVVKINRLRNLSGVICSDGMLQFYSNEDLIELTKPENYELTNKKIKLKSFTEAADNVSGLFFFE